MRAVVPALLGRLRAPCRKPQPDFRVGRRPRRCPGLDPTGPACQRQPPDVLWQQRGRVLRPVGGALALQRQVEQRACARRARRPAAAAVENASVHEGHVPALQRQPTTAGREQAARAVFGALRPGKHSATVLGVDVNRRGVRAGEDLRRPEPAGDVVQGDKASDHLPHHRPWMVRVERLRLRAGGRDVGRQLDHRGIGADQLGQRVGQCAQQPGQRPPQPAQPKRQQHVVALRVALAEPALRRFFPAVGARRGLRVMAGDRVERFRAAALVEDPANDGHPVRVHGERRGPGTAFEAERRLGVTFVHKMIGLVAAACAHHCTT
mmetsp:Transcript_150531/g.483968  ORF Transcript_150531/g.483968 Transcript_150531/m.483968 type:complete len:322 (+) Transcript_150531:306-1271(+)